MSPHAVRARRARGRTYMRKSRPVYIGAWSDRGIKDSWAMGYLVALIAKALRKRGYSPDAIRIFWERIGEILTPEPKDNLDERRSRHILKNLDRYIALSGLST